MNLPNFDADTNPAEPSAQLTEKLYLDRLADQIRNIWIEEWRRNYVKTYGKLCAYKPGPRLDGGQDIHGHKFPPVWPKFARFIFERNYNPIAYIRAQFENCGDNPPINPTVLMGSRAIKRYQLYQANHEVERELEVAKDSQIRHARDAIELNKLLYGPGRTAYRVTILDESLPLSALFRYSLAYTCGEQDLAEIWFDAALLQYSYEHQTYDATWKELIPQPLKESISCLHNL